mmetsp:Transcript_23509/g.75426  ORF Transcript_23509/g.75426 Transcript_23509/m.75426 type:complete len:251 (+) Transcript_23509:279-1031(+)
MVSGRFGLASRRAISRVLSSKFGAPRFWGVCCCFWGVFSSGLLTSVFGGATCAAFGGSLIRTMMGLLRGSSFGGGGGGADGFLVFSFIKESFEVVFFFLVVVVVVVGAFAAAAEDRFLGDFWSDGARFRFGLGFEGATRRESSSSSSSSSSLAALAFLRRGRPLAEYKTTGSSSSDSDSDSGWSSMSVRFGSSSLFPSSSPFSLWRSSSMKVLRSAVGTATCTLRPLERRLSQAGQNQLPSGRPARPRHS